MKLIIDIPQEFEAHFNQDKFKDSIGRIAADVISQVYEENSISGNYEMELLNMLSEAFEKAESIHSTCVLEGKPIYNDAPALEAKWTYLHGDRNGDGDIIGIGECSNCHQPCECDYYCPNFGAKLMWNKLRWKD
jgi:hypothetical protein